MVRTGSRFLKHYSQRQYHYLLTRKTEKTNLSKSNSADSKIHELNLSTFLQEIYPDLKCNVTNIPWLMSRAILTPLNVNVDDLNNKILDSLSLPATAIKTYRSVDLVADRDHEHLYPAEFLNSLRISGLPPHSARLAVGLPIMLLSRRLL